MPDRGRPKSRSPVEARWQRGTVASRWQLRQAADRSQPLSQGEEAISETREARPSEADQEAGGSRGGSWHVRGARLLGRLGMRGDHQKTRP